MEIGEVSVTGDNLLFSSLGGVASSSDSSSSKDVHEASESRWLPREGLRTFELERLDTLPPLSERRNVPVPAMISEDGRAGL